MATQTLSRSRSLLSKPKSLSSFLFPSSRSFSSSAAASSTKTVITPSPPPSLSFLRRLRAPPFYSPLLRDSLSPSVKSFSTRAARSSLNDPNPNYSNRPPKETILLDGCDFEHWLVVMEAPKDDATRDDIIDNYIKTLAQVVGSEDEARMKIYSVSTRHYYAFGALVSEELSYKIKEIPGVRWVLPDSYLDVKNKDYGGEPFINGQAVPYDPKYHEEWVRNNARANERNRRNDRPRNDRPRNYDRSRDGRRENMQPNREMPPPNQGTHNAAGGMPPNNMRGMPPNNMGNVPPNQGWSGNAHNFQNGPNYGNAPGNAQNYQNGPNYGNAPGNAQNYQNGPNYGNAPGNAQNYQNGPNYGNAPGNAQNYQNGPNYGNTPYQGGTPNAQYQNNYAPNSGGGNIPGGNYQS
ncbi:hypothetical protein GQ457_13G003980 [Hibiscus cannabinus]